MHTPPELSRRTFLTTTGAGLVAPCLARAAEPRPHPVALGQKHHEAVNRKRRIAVQYDAWSQLGHDFQEWLDYRFDYIDEPGTQIDSIWWDITAMGNSTYPSKILKPLRQVGLDRWRKQGIDWVGRLVAETRKRKREVFWSHRISEVELNDDGTGAGWNGKPHPIKQAHPDWVIKTWWKQGLWNLASAGVRDFKVRVLRELATNYDFDGFQIDFARHIPCLPPGRQWELRAHVTRFMRDMRLMLKQVAEKRKRPILLAARIPCDLAGCRHDGFDIAEWARQNLVDILTLGSRSIDCDIEGFRRLTRGRNIKLQPCLDDHHATDAYQYPPVEYFRGVAANWWRQGADSLLTFNWSNADPQFCRKMDKTPGPLSHQQAYHEIGSPGSLRDKDKIFVVQRRGGYPWAEGAFNRNDRAVLPLQLSKAGSTATVSLRVGDHLATSADRLEQVLLRLIVFGTVDRKTLDVKFNGVPTRAVTHDVSWKDRQIFSPRPQPSSGGADGWKIDPNQKLTRLDFRIPPRLCKAAGNQVSLRSSGKTTIKLEKVELHVDYA